MNSMVRIVVPVAILFGLSNSFGQQGWFWQNPLPLGNHFRGVQTINPNLIVAVGDQGTILKSSDAGMTWNVQLSGVSVSIAGVCFTDANNGYAVGDSGTVLHTIDGGKFWLSQSIGTMAHLYGVSFANASIGMIVGDQGAIYRTTDGGHHWVSQFGSPDQILYSVKFHDVNNGTCTGAYGAIFRTTNGGAKWNRQYSGTDYELYGASFPNASTGTVVGELGTILHTTDGGDSWISQPSGVSDRLSAVSFSDPQTGTIVGDNGLIIRSTDGGATWTNQSAGTETWLTAISFVNANVGTTAGSYGVIYRTTNGGASWVLVTTGTRFPLYDIKMIDENHGTVVGGFGTVLTTSDGGASWIPRITNTRSHLRNIAFFDRDTAVICGDDRTVLRTTNAGTSWTTVSLPVDSINPTAMSAVAFGPSGLGWLGGWSDTLVVNGSRQSILHRGLIWKTTNGGSNWSRLSADTLGQVSSIKILSDSSALVMSSWARGFSGGKLFLTLDSGKSWTLAIPSWYPIHSISFGSPTKGIVVGDGGNVLWSTNGGVTWRVGPNGTTTTATKQNLLGVSLVDSLNGFAVGEKMTIIRTRDGGKTWSSELTGWDLNFNAVWTIDTLRQIVVGDGGTILANYYAGPATAVQRNLQSETVPRFFLAQNFPNPFNPTTAISFQLPAVSRVELKVFDLLGREVAVLVNGVMNGGPHQVRWDASRFPSGIYYYRLRIGNELSTKSMILLR